MNIFAMKKLIILWSLALFSLLTINMVVASGSVHLESANIDRNDKASLQRGAKTFINYCLSCHSAQYQRFERMADDLGFDKQDVINNMMYTQDKIGNTMTVAMPAEDAKKWFGKPVPDLSLVARSRGVDWLYTYLISFYLDEKRPTGVNNLLFKDVGMPHVLWEQQGYKKLVKNPDGEHTLETAVKGTMTDKEYQDMVRDLVNFLAYIGEPLYVYRHQLGMWVLLFLAVFFVIAYMLKKEYWKDVH